MSKIEALKEYFGKIRPVTNGELMHLKREDPAGYDQLAQDAAKELGVTLA